jgi:hypothetical protein
VRQVGYLQRLYRDARSTERRNNDLSLDHSVQFANMIAFQLTEWPWNSMRGEKSLLAVIHVFKNVPVDTKPWLSSTILLLNLHRLWP